MQLHLVSHTPGLLSFGHTAAGQQGLFEYPLIQVTLSSPLFNYFFISQTNVIVSQDPGSQFRHQTEDGRVVQTSLDLASVPLKGGVLRSGARARIPVGSMA